VTDIETYMQKLGIRGKLLKLTVPTPTVESAAQALGTTVDRIVKSLLFIINGEPTLVISLGTQRVDRKRLAKHFNVGRKRVKLANADTVLELTGFVIGAVPPFGHRSNLSVILDKSILDKPVVYAGGGSTQSMLAITPDELLRVTSAIVLDLHSDNSEKQV
jgi:Cys-tRNA(Pro) deacylase